MTASSSPTAYAWLLSLGADGLRTVPALADYLRDEGFTVIPDLTTGAYPSRRTSAR